MRRATRTLPDPYGARFQGARWTVAMRGGDWKIFCALPAVIYSRLTAILEHFCDQGEADMPRSTFAWLARAASDPPGLLQGAFEAHGVVIYGRRAVHGSGNSFFVTNIVADLPPPGSSSKRRTNTDGRQGRLPFQSESEGEL